MTEETINNNNTNSIDGETIKKLKQQLLFEKEKNNILGKIVKEKKLMEKNYYNLFKKIHNDVTEETDTDCHAQMVFKSFKFLQFQEINLEDQNNRELYQNSIGKEKCLEITNDNDNTFFHPVLFSTEDVITDLLLPLYENWLEEQNKNLTTKEGKKFVVPFEIQAGYPNEVDEESKKTFYGYNIHDLVEKKYQELLPKRQLQKDLIQYVKRQEFGTKENGKIKYEPSLIKSRFQSQILEFETIVDKLKEIGKEKEEQDEYIKSFLIWAYSGKDHIADNKPLKKYLKDQQKEQGKEEIKEFQKIIKTIDPKTTIIDWHHCLTQLYFDEESKDFEIIITDEKSNENNPTTIKVHKWVLVSRSGMFRNFFQSTENKTTNQVTDYSKRSLSFWKIFIKYLYTSNIELEDKLDEKVINEFKEASDYFQLNDESNLLWRLLQNKIN
ncbi:hypothetical protein M0813_29189 [Anaeramoeba flamelloides]|uniref:BTB domain-containing protein n=1 Tax=Anaeramoeba flamelloides TaxID=1746091 RepID=A0ABQ8XPQ8_9EUKA|nr:hypothetical protein M0813_29189 [Anaeramoeba flamelloides]